MEQSGNSQKRSWNGHKTPWTGHETAWNGPRILQNIPKGPGTTRSSGTVKESLEQAGTVEENKNQHKIQIPSYNLTLCFVVEVICFNGKKYTFNAAYVDYNLTCYYIYLSQ